MLYYGIEIPEKFDTPTWPLAFLRWLKDFKWNYDTVDQTLKSMLCQYQFIDLQIKDVSTRIRAYCRRHYKKDYYLLRSVPGIGPITAANIISELGDLRRFQSLKKLAGYIGIAPGMYCSGDNEKFTGATPRANRTIRSLIVEASWVAIRQDPVLQQYYRKHAGKDSKAAIFKVSRKLLSRIHAVIKSEITYEIGIVQ
jgi:transposase